MRQLTIMLATVAMTLVSCAPQADADPYRGSITVSEHEERRERQAQIEPDEANGTILEQNLAYEFYPHNGGLTEGFDPNRSYRSYGNNLPTEIVTTDGGLRFAWLIAFDDDLNPEFDEKEEYWQLLLTYYGREPIFVDEVELSWGSRRMVVIPDDVRRSDGNPSTDFMPIESMWLHLSQEIFGSIGQANSLEIRLRGVNPKTFRLPPGALANFRQLYRDLQREEARREES